MCRFHVWKHIALRQRSEIMRGCRAVCECALSGLRVRTLGPASAHSRARECALIFHPAHSYL